MEKRGYVYIMTNCKRGVLYVGVTSNLVQRVWQHKEGVTEGFTKQYHCKMLVYYEIHENMQTAIEYEKKLKNRGREWKMNLIETENLEWKDLYATITQ